MSNVKIWLRYNYKNIISIQRFFFISIQTISSICKITLGSANNANNNCFHCRFIHWSFTWRLIMWSEAKKKKKQVFISWWQNRHPVVRGCKTWALNLSIAISETRLKRQEQIIFSTQSQEACSADIFILRFSFVIILAELIQKVEGSLFSRSRTLHRGTELKHLLPVQHKSQNKWHVGALCDT